AKPPTTLWPKNDPRQLHNTNASGAKERLLPILQLSVDRLAAALLAEKEVALAWHFRAANPEQAAHRASELTDDLSRSTRNSEVQVLEGNKVIEVRNSGVTKGTAAQGWIGNAAPDFILGIGDDQTDEDFFRILPDEAYSVRVGLANTAAKYYLSSYSMVR